MLNTLVKLRTYLSPNIPAVVSLQIINVVKYVVNYVGATPASRKGTSIGTVTLNNGVHMPVLGFGTLYLNGEVGVRCVADALSLGYRLIDLMERVTKSIPSPSGWHSPIHCRTSSSLLPYLRRPPAAYPGR